MSIAKDILWPHPEDFDVSPWMSTDFSAHRMKFSLGQRQKMWQCEAYTPTPTASTMLKSPYSADHHVFYYILSGVSESALCTSTTLQWIL